MTTDTDDVLADLDIDDELLRYATDEELDAYLTALKLEAKAEELTWEYQPRQATAERLAGVVAFETLYGGAAGGGKSDWLLHHMYDHALKYPGFMGLLLRRTFPELRRSLILRSYARFERAHCRYLATEHFWRFNNGSILEFGYLERDPDVYQYQSAEYDAIGWDELTQFPTSTPYTYLMSRCRTTIDKRVRGLMPHVIAGTNPGGVGGTWVKERFIDPAEPEEVHEIVTDIEGEAPRASSAVFVPAKLSDNKFIDAGSYRQALAHLPTATRKALENGSWDVVEGQYFTEWNRDIHVIAPFEIPPWWVRIRGLDYGYANPMCCLWAAVDPDDNLYVYNELYGRGMLPGEQAAQILEKSRRAGHGRSEKVQYTVADPSVWARTGAGPPIASQYVQAGLPVRKASNARVDGWARVRAFLKPDPHTKLPAMFIFSSCKNLIRTLPMQVVDTDNPEDLDTRGEDHAADALRYLCMSRPPRSARPPREPLTVEARLAENHRKRIARRGSKKLVDTPLGDVY